jgi:hypothetical protein
MIHLQNLAFASDIEALKKAGQELADQLLTARLEREARGEARRPVRPFMERWVRDDYYSGADDYGL